MDIFQGPRGGPTHDELGRVRTEWTPVASAPPCTAPTAGTLLLPDRFQTFASAAACRTELRGYFAAETTLAGCARWAAWRDVRLVFPDGLGGDPDGCHSSSLPRPCVSRESQKLWQGYYSLSSRPTRGNGRWRTMDDNRFQHPPRAEARHPETSLGGADRRVDGVESLLRLVPGLITPRIRDGRSLESCRNGSSSALSPLCVSEASVYLDRGLRKSQWPALGV